jgi:hypothetical protein
MKYIVTLGFTLLLLSATGANANCIRDQDGRVVCGGGQCERDSHGKVYCAQPGGGAMKGRYGEVQCGVGYCARNRDGEVWCSRRRGGGAALDSYGEVKCLDGCHRGSAERCEEGQ